VGPTTIEIVRLVTLRTAVPVAVGLVHGLGVGALAAFALGGFIVGVSPADPLTLAATTVLVVGTTHAASTLPALRAASVAPLKALRAE
jgi:ABC-type lipoprotein release transport system permease subunit